MSAKQGEISICEKNGSFKKSKFRKNPIVIYFETNAGMVIGLAALCIIFSLASPQFFSETNLINILRQISMNAIIAFGMTVVLIVGGIDLSVGSVAAFSGCTAAVLMSGGIPFVLAILVSAASGIVVGSANGVVIAKIKMPSFIVTLATMTIVRGFTYIITDGKARPIQSDIFDGVSNYRVLGILPLPIIIMIVVGLAMSLTLNSTRFGRNTYAVGGNRDCANFSGVSVARTEIMVFAVNGLLAAISGLIFASRQGAGSPMVADGAEMDAIAAVVLGGASFSGGIGKIGGTVIGALVFGVLANGLNMVQVNYYWQQVIKGAIILVAVYVDLVKKKK